VDFKKHLYLALMNLNPRVIPGKGTTPFKLVLECFFLLFLKNNTIWKLL